MRRAATAWTVEPLARLLQLLAIPVAPVVLVTLEFQVLRQPLLLVPGDDRRAVAHQLLGDLAHVDAIGIVAGVAGHTDDHIALVDGRRVPEPCSGSGPRRAALYRTRRQCVYQLSKWRATKPSVP